MALLFKIASVIEAISPLPITSHRPSMPITSYEL